MNGYETPCSCMRNVLLLVQRLVARPLLEEIVVGLDVLGEVDDLTASGFVAVTPKRQNLLVGGQLICLGHFFFREDRLIWTFGDARAAVDAGIRVDEVPGPLVF